MKMEQLQDDYAEAAAHLRLAIEDRKDRAEKGDAVARREVALLRQMLGEMRDLRQLTEGYYTRPRDGHYTTSTLRAPRVDANKR